jgi:hypothetical protein
VGAYVDRLASGSATGVNSQLAKGYGRFFFLWLFGSQKLINFA